MANLGKFSCLMDDEHVEVAIPPRPTFTREQKFGYALVITCGVLAVVLGVFYMSKHVKAPFIISYTGSRFVTGDEAAAAEVAQQKATDTDGDTISDYDEMKIYGSSPYLRDTDSDGVSDDVEIATNQDPTCAKGDACEDEGDEIMSVNPINEGMVGDVATSAAAATQQLEQIRLMLANQSPNDIRVMLIDSGADEAQVNAMTDAELTEFYATVLGELEANGGLATLLEQVQAQTTADAAATAESDNAATTTP